MPRFGRGPLGAAAGQLSGVRGGGAALASTAAAASSFLGGYLVYQASILRATYFMQTSSSTSSSLSMASHTRGQAWYRPWDPESHTPRKLAR
jgi:hypothetical protein